MRIDTDLSRLPIAPHVLFEVIGLCNEAECLAADILPIIRKDMALAARLASVFSGPGGPGIDALSGTDAGPLPNLVPTIRAVASSAAVHQFFQPFNPEYSRQWGNLWLNGLACAHLSRQLAVITGQLDPGGAFTAGLLHQLGRLVYFVNDSDNYALMLNGATTMETLTLKEHKRYGISSTDLSATLIQRWTRRGFLSDAVRYQGLPADLLQDASDLVKLVNLTSNLCGHMLFNSDKDSDIRDPFFGLEQRTLEHQVAEALASAMAEARDIGMEVDETSDGPKPILDSESIHESLGMFVRDAALQEGILLRAGRSSDLAELTSIIPESSAILFDMPSVICFFPDHDSGEMHAARGSHHNQQHPELAISLQAERSLVSEAALKKRLYLSSHQEVFAELPVIDRQLRDLLNADALACLPLVHQRRVYAVLAIGCSESQADELHEDSERLQLFARATARLIAEQTLTDATHQEQLQQQHQEAWLRIRKIIHEVNNPLTIVTNYLEILTPELKTSGDSGRQLETIKSEIERVADILQGFREESMELAKDQSMVYINQLVIKLVDFFEPTLYKNNKIKSVLRLDPSDPAITTDAIKLKQIVTNILKNAIEALSDQGEITIRTRGLVVMNSEQYVEISISDNGKGLPLQVIQKLYTPVESGKGPEHSGLGLAIVYKLVSELRGMIRYSPSDSGGAEFTLLLPKS